MKLLADSMFAQSILYLVLIDYFWIYKLGFDNCNIFLFTFTRREGNRVAHELVSLSFIANENY